MEDKMTQLAKQEPQSAITAIEKVLIGGDLAALTAEQRMVYYQKVCDSVGLNPITKPFEYIALNGKLVLYATRACTEQLRKINGVSLKITAREKIGDVYVVTAQARMPDGREDESTGAVALGKLAGDALANAYLKCETKAKRRVTLSICGLATLDETEVETIPGATRPNWSTNGPAVHPQDAHNRPISSSEPKQTAEPEVMPKTSPAGKLGGSGAFCKICQTELVISKSGAGYYCPRFKESPEGEHTRIKASDLEEFKAEQDNGANEDAYPAPEAPLPTVDADPGEFARFVGK
jgi:hypothetical protein